MQEAIFLTNSAPYTDRFKYQILLLSLKAITLSSQNPNPTRSPMSSLSENRVAAKQILRQASELQDASMFGPPRQKTRDSSGQSSVKLALCDDELIENARDIYEQMVQRHPEEAGNWIRYANFEMKNGDIAGARNVFERAVKKVPLADDEEEDDDGAEQLFEAFAEFERRCKDTELCKLDVEDAIVQVQARFLIPRSKLNLF